MNTYFKINNHLELRLENNKTTIYVNNELFRHCKYLLFDIQKNETKKYDFIDSIDEAAQYLNKDNEKNKTINISPQMEFFGHCSNLQAWYENDYDTRILHSNLSFPLLKKLSAYDSRAKIRFDEELVKRLNDGYEPVQKYLLNQNMDDLMKLSDEAQINIKYTKINILTKIFRMELCNKSLAKIPHLLMKMTGLKYLKLENNNLSFLSENIGTLENLEYLCLGGNNLDSLPDSFNNLKNLNTLEFYANNFNKVPEPISNLKELKALYLNHNNIQYLPDWIGELTNLRELFIGNNNLDSLPDSIGKLKNLDMLDLGNNNLDSLPESITELKNLRVLNVENNDLKSIPKYVKELKNLKVLIAKGNKLNNKIRIRRCNVHC